MSRQSANESKQLHEMVCEACRAGAPHVSDEELKMLMPQIPEWSALVRDEILMLERIYKFGNFVDAMAFSNRVAEIAETFNHHPAMYIEWGQVTVTWWSHKIRGLHKTDLIMAAKTDQQY